MGSVAGSCELASKGSRNDPLHSQFWLQQSKNTQKLYVNIESPQTNKGMGAVRVCALLAGNYELTTDDVSDR